MDITEIENYIVSRDICVDRTALASYPGYIRDLLFLPENRVVISFYHHTVFSDRSLDGEEWRCWCDFSSLQSAIPIVEAYLQKPVAQWINVTRSGYQPSVSFTQKEYAFGAITFIDDVFHKRIIVPSGFRTNTFKGTIAEHFRHMEDLKQHYGLA